MTVEPGCYFNKYLIEPIKDSPHLNQGLLQKYLLEGGVRIGMLSVHLRLVMLMLWQRTM